MSPRPRCCCRRMLPHHTLAHLIAHAPPHGHAGGSALPLWEAYVHGAHLTLLDGLGLGLGMSNAAAQQLRIACEGHLMRQVPGGAAAMAAASFTAVPLALSDRAAMPAGLFGAAPFFVPQARDCPSPHQHSNPSKYHRSSTDREQLSGE